MVQFVLNQSSVVGVVYEIQNCFNICLLFSQKRREKLSKISVSHVIHIIIDERD